MLIDKLREALRDDFGGTTVRVYVPRRPKIDWTAVQDERRQGATAADLAKRLGCSERTVIRRAPLRGGK